MTEHIPEELLPLDDRPASQIPVVAEPDAYRNARIFETVRDVTRGQSDPTRRADIAARVMKSFGIEANL